MIDVVEMGKANVRDFAEKLINDINNLPKCPNGHSDVYDERQIINMVNARLAKEMER